MTANHEQILLIVAQQLREMADNISVLLAQSEQVEDSNNRDTIDQLRKACAEQGIEIAPDDTITEADAAQLCGRKRNTLKNRRLGDQPISPSRNGTRAVYKLQDLAASKYFNEAYEDWL